MASSLHLNLSFWELDSFFREIDVVVIGSGIVGLNAALALKEMDTSLKIVILERGVLPSGASTRNAGFACFGSISELLDDLENGMNENEIWQLLEERWKGLIRLRHLLSDANIDYHNWGSFEIFKNDESRNYQNCLESIEKFNQRLVQITGLADTFAPCSRVEIDRFGLANVEGMIVNKAEGQLHTGKMMSGLLRKAEEAGIKIYNGLEVLQIEEKEQVVVSLSNGWNLTTKKVLVATNGFSQRLLPDLKVVPARNQVLMTGEIQNLKIRGCFHSDKGYYYFRNVGKRILFGGGRNLMPNEEQTANFGLTDTIQENLEQILSEIILPNQSYKIEHRWSGILGIGPTKQPIVEQISTNVVAAVRLGGMGVAIGSLIGQLGAIKLIEC